MAADGLHFHKKEQLAPLRTDWNKNRLRLIKNIMLRAVRCVRLQWSDEKSKVKTDSVGCHQWMCHIHNPLSGQLYIYRNKKLFGTNMLKDVDYSQLLRKQICCTRRKKKKPKQTRLDVKLNEVGE